METGETDRSYLSGFPIRVLAGCGRKALYVHSTALLACDSPSLTALVEGGWKESADREIDWTEFDYYTIERFLTFLYTGDYRVPELGLVAQTTVYKDAEAVLTAAASDQGSPGPAGAYETDLYSAREAFPWDKPPDLITTRLDEKAAVEQPRPLTPLSRCLEVGLPPEHARTDAGLLARLDSQSQGCYFGPALLAHAKVYTFAQYHLVAKLEIFSLQRLTHTLVSIDPVRPGLIPDFVSVVRHVYGNTAVRGEAEDPARKLLCQFTAFNYTQLMRDKFEELTLEGGEFMLDLSRKLSRRLGSGGISGALLERQVDELEKKVQTMETQLSTRDSTITYLSRELNQWRSLSGGSSKKRKKW